MNEILPLDPSADDELALFRAALLRACTEGATDMQVNHDGGMRMLKANAWTHIGVLPVELLPRLQRLLCFGSETVVGRGSFSLIVGAKLTARCRVVFLPAINGGAGHISLRISYCNTNSALIDVPIFSADATACLGKAFLKRAALIVITGTQVAVRTAAIRKVLEHAPTEMVQRACALTTNGHLVRMLLEDGVLAIHVDPSRGTDMANSLKSMLRLGQPLVVIDPLEESSASEMVGRLVQTGIVAVITIAADDRLIDLIKKASEAANFVCCLSRGANGLWGCNPNLTSRF